MWGTVHFFRGHITDEEAVPFWYGRCLWIYKGVAKAKERSNLIGSGGRRPEVANASDRGDGAGRKIEVAGEWNRKRGLTESLTHSVDMGTPLSIFGIRINPTPNCPIIITNNEFIVRFATTVNYW